MGQKINPEILRIPINHRWNSKWFAKGNKYSILLEEDFKIRNFIKKNLNFAMICKIFIERSGTRIRIKIYTARPGIVIGRKGQELEKLRFNLKNLTKKDVILDIKEVKNPDIVAQLVAENIALQLEKRIAFRRAMKKAIQSAKNVGVGIEGIKIQVSGRLGGSEIARMEWTREGRVPLQTIREKIDFGFCEAKTIYGKIGVKCWICLNFDILDY